MEIQNLSLDENAAIVLEKGSAKSGNDKEILNVRKAK